MGYFRIAYLELSRGGFVDYRALFAQNRRSAVAQLLRIALALLPKFDDQLRKYDCQGVLTIQ